MFYDFGTLKTYPPEHIYYLHKQFSHLPALAIPCGLYGIKPCVGDRWKKSVTEQFADKTGDNLLVADIVSVDLPVRLIYYSLFPEVNNEIRIFSIILSVGR